MNLKRSAGKPVISSWYAARACLTLGVSRSVAWSVFFSWHPQFLQHLAQLRQADANVQFLRQTVS